MEALYGRKKVAKGSEFDGFVKPKLKPVFSIIFLRRPTKNWHVEASPPQVASLYTMGPQILPPKAAKFEKISRRQWQQGEKILICCDPAANDGGHIHQGIPHPLSYLAH